MENELTIGIEESCLSKKNPNFCQPRLRVNQVSHRQIANNVIGV